MPSPREEDGEEEEEKSLSALKRRSTWTSTVAASVGSVLLLDTWPAMAAMIVAVTAALHSAAAFLIFHPLFYAVAFPLFTAYQIWKLRDMFGRRRIDWDTYEREEKPWREHQDDEKSNGHRIDEAGSLWFYGRNYPRSI